jgi:hypothetical protein
MIISDIKELINNYILQSLDGSRGIENNKLDFKREWYPQMNKDEGQFKFLIDVTALANSYGGGDAFLIIGYDEKNRSFIDSSFVNTGLRDTSDLIGIIRRKIDRPFNIQYIEHIFDNGQKHILSIIHIPPSLDKPHVIRSLKLDKGEFPNEIFIRKGDTNERASKADLDLMYAEKGNIILDRKAIAAIRLPNSNFTHTKHWQGHKVETDDNIFFFCEISIENLGFRPLAINCINLNVDLISNGDVVDFNLKCKLEPAGYSKDKNLILPNSIEIIYLTFSQSIPGYTDEESKKAADLMNSNMANEDLMVFKRIEFLLSNGESFLPELRIVKS